MASRYSRFWPLTFVVLLTVAPIGNVAISEEFAGGTISLPHGYHLRQDRNWDTPVATGVIENHRMKIHVSYSYGSVFGIVPPPLGCADPATLRRLNYKVLWSKQSGVGRLRKIITFAENRRLKERELYIAFPSGGPANFVATINSDADIAEVERIIDTFDPKSSSARKITGE